MFEELKQISAGVLDIGYAEAGPDNGQPVILLHGWPYDIHSYVDVAPALGAAGYRVIVPYLRGFGTTRFLSDDTIRNGQQSVVAVDVIALMDALHIESAIIAGFDWGARTANVVAALWPDRCKAMVSVSGYLIGSPEANKAPLPPRAELAWWYQFYFATERGRDGYDKYRRDFRQAHLADRVATVELRRCDLRSQRRGLRQRRSRQHCHPQLPVADRPGSRRAQYDELEKLLAEAPVIAVPTITLEGDANGAPHLDPSAYAGKFSGKYVHRNISGGVGHNFPQEAPQPFAEAVMEVDRYA
jgi:pimeloyl-ACP methyl ester carboxylesterase